MNTRFDVAIVGAGFAGTTAAAALGRSGLSVALVDLQAVPSPAFRAEKFSADQLGLLRSLDMLEPLTEATSLATWAINVRGRRVIDFGAVQDHGLPYADIVSVLRRQLPASVRFMAGKVRSLALDEQGGALALADGSRVEARLVVLATGHARALRESVGVERRLVHPTPTLSIAFTLKPPPQGFRFPSLAAYGEVTGDGVDYTSIFPIGRLMRVNVFAFGSLAEPRIAAFRRDPLEALLKLQPGLAHWLQGCRAVDAAGFFSLELSICERVLQPGLVLIGDAFRTSCPAVGNGLSCVLVDVERLRHHAPGWMATPGMGVDKIAQFYEDPVKLAVDRETHRLAIERRRVVMSRTLVNRARRRIHFGRRRVANFLSPGGGLRNDAAGWACHAPP